MNAQAKVEKAKKEPDNLRLWNALSKTDPAHTKGFKRAGGFQGTALKPIWVERQLTELFGPCGIGWGIDEPSFRLVEAGDELMVYCTVAGWYIEDGKRATVYGVGGDKVVAKNKFGLSADDEAFKKACTDATGNAFKHVGVGADIHMGLFEDSKYLAEVREEFRPKTEEPKPGERHPGENFDAREKLEGPYSSGSALRGAIKAFAESLRVFEDDLAGFNAWMESADVVELEKQALRYLPGWWDTGEGCAKDFEPMTSRIHRKRKELEELENIHETSGAKYVNAG